MIEIFAGQVPKDVSSPEFWEDIEDVFAIKVSGACAVVAVCDGASRSYDAKNWARAVAEGFIADSYMTCGWIKQIVARYNASQTFGKMESSKLKAILRGSFSTLLGIKITGEDVSLSAVGDTNAFLLKAGNLVDSFPYKRADQFSLSTVAFSSVLKHNALYDDSEFQEKSRTLWHIDGVQTTILCMTDALAQWSMRSAQSGGDPWQRLCGITTDEGLREMVMSERAERRMRQDDVTLVRLSYGGKAQPPQPSNCNSDGFFRSLLKLLSAEKPDKEADQGA